VFFNNNPQVVKPLISKAQFFTKLSRMIYTVILINGGSLRRNIDKLTLKGDNIRVWQNKKGSGLQQWGF